MIRRRDVPALVMPLLSGCGARSERRVSIALAPGLLEVYLTHLARQLGHFRDEGLDVSLDELTGSRQLESLLAGSSDAVYTSFSTILYLAVEERAVRSFFVGMEALSAMLVASAGSAARLQRVEDLRGATVGVSGFGTAQQNTLEIILSRHGLAMADVTLIAYGSGPSAVAALQYGKVDAGVINGSAFSVLKRRVPNVRILVDPRTREGTRELTGAERYANYCLISTPAWLGRHSELARKLTKAMLRTLHWVHAHQPEELREHLPAAVRSDDAEADLESLRILIQGTSKDGRMSPKVPEDMRRYIAVSNQKVRNAKFDLASTYTNQFLDEVSR
ncbi:MAG: ABC transporter substrate-binding protein [Bryobacterales bacterium]|nr:ABC transporter substrate-binding protein [Bryobacterales bacterium]